MDKWRFYKTAMGGEVVKDELNALSDEKKATLNSLRKRYTSGQLLDREIELVEKGLWALRTTVEGSELRLYFGRVAKGGAICLAVLVLDKKSRGIPKKDLRKARDRLSEWKGRNPPTEKPKV